MTTNQQLKEQLRNTKEEARSYLKNVYSIAENYNTDGQKSYIKCKKVIEEAVLENKSECELFYKHLNGDFNLATKWFHYDLFGALKKHFLDQNIKIEMSGINNGSHVTIIYL